MAAIDENLNKPPEILIETGKDLLTEERTIGRGIRLIRELSRAGKNSEAIALAEFLFDRRKRARDLNLLLSVTLASEDTEQIKERVDFVRQYHASSDFEYDVQLVATWLRALCDIDEAVLTSTWGTMPPFRHFAHVTPMR